MWWNKPFTAIDTETTGLNWFEDRVIQIGVSYFESGKYLGGYSHIINSGRPSALEAIETHGITDYRQYSEGEMPPAILVPTQHAIEGSQFLVIMNAPFDLNFLIMELSRLNRELKVPHIIDPLVIDRFYSKNRIPSLARGKRTLKAMSERYGIHDYPLHDAGHDSRRVGELAIEMAQRHGQLGRSPLSELMKKQRTWHRQWSDEFASYADVKGFFFNRAEWPCMGDKWQPIQSDQLPLDSLTRKGPLTRRANPAQAKECTEQHS
jgi:DNA polymerase III epsilon subunit-like protein